MASSQETASDPPEHTVTLLENEDLPKQVVRWDDVQLPIDILLLTVKDCEFLGCLSYLNRGFRKSYRKDLGFVYFGDMGEDEPKLRIAVMKSLMGSGGPGASTVTVMTTVRVLMPKVVFYVGFCGGLNFDKVKLGDVVILVKLITYASSKDTENGIEERGVRVPLNSDILKMILNAGEGWKAPLKDPEERKVKIHRGTFLSGPEVIDNNERRKALVKRFPEATAIEMEGEGLYAAAHALNIDWIVIKGVSDYADGRKSETNSWRRFSSLMAASLTAHILSTPMIVFQDWPHYNGSANSSIPPEIRARGQRAELAYQKAMQSGKVKVYRGRIMLLGQARAGKTSLKKSLLGMPFDPKEESTIGIDPSKCEVEIDQVKNWRPTEGKKPLESDAAKDIARLMAKDLNEAAVNQKDMHGTDSSSEPEQMPASLYSVDASQPVGESTPDITQESNADINIPGGKATQSNNLKIIKLDVDNTAPKDVTEELVRYLKGLDLEDEIKAKEAILTLWDFAGQHIFYASHSVFLSMRAVYVLVYNLSKSLIAEAEPCVRQGKNDILLDNPNNETNLDNLLSWLVSIHSIRPTEEEAAVKDLNNQGANLSYLRPPVFIVGTNADQPCEDAKKMVRCIQDSISRKSYEKHVIRPFFAVDNTKSQSDDGVQKLQTKIIEVLKQEPYMGEEVPLRWFNFEKVVEKLVREKNTNHIALDQLLTLTRNVCHIDDEEELTAMLNFFHDLGVIVKYGQTVVLQAQWLIDLFKQLITVRPFDEADPLYSECWNELEESGILRITLVDHVFTDFIQKGLNKQDILDMMELYGLIVKFPCLSSEDKLEQKYLVPAQLKSSPSGLCSVQPSQSDPCPLYIHFPDGFVHHGLFSQLVSRCISFCSEQGLIKPPQLFNNGVRFFVGMQATFALVLICRKRFIKVILKKRNASSTRSTTTAATAKMAGEVRAFLEATLQILSRDLSWLRNLRYEVCVVCTYCLQSGDQCTKHKLVRCSSDDCLHLLEVVPGEDLICQYDYGDEAIKVDGLEKWFQVQKVKTDEQKVEKLTPEDQPQPLTSSSPSSDDLLLLAFELGELDTSWKMLGRVLRLSELVLEQIEEDEGNLVEKCYSVLRRWTETFEADATYQCLARGLQHPTVGRPRLAAKYCDCYRETIVGQFVNQRRYEQAARASPSTSLQDSVPHGEDKPSDQVLNKLARYICADWPNLGLELKVPDENIQQISLDHVLYPTVQRKAYQVLKAWKNRGESVTYDELCRALNELGLNELAESLRTM